MTKAICPPASSIASIAWMVEPPVVMTSSTTTTESPDEKLPSIRFSRPCSFAVFRTVKTWSGPEESCRCAAIPMLSATGSAPMVRAPIASTRLLNFDPFFLEGILRRPVVLVKDAEDARERQLRQFIGGELVGDVVAQLVLGGVVPFLFLDQLEAAAFARIGRIEGAGIKFDTFTQTFDGGKAGMIHGALDHLDHVIDLGGVGARDEGGTGADELFHRIDRHVDRADRIGLGFESDGRRGRGLLFGQAIDKVVHDEINHVDVLPRAMIEMVAADGKTVAVAPEEKNMQVGSGQADAGSKRNGAAVNEVRAVTVDEIGKTR